MNEAINPYMVFDGDPADGAALVFAATAREARRRGFNTLRGWFDSEWITTRARLQREHRDYLMGLYDGRAVIDAPPSCPVCEKWGAPIRDDGKGCEFCYMDWPDEDPALQANGGQAHDTGDQNANSTNT